MAKKSSAMHAKLGIPPSQKIPKGTILAANRMTGKSPIIKKK